MADGARIGLNEVELGIAVPKFWAALMARTVSPGVAEKLCAFAQMADAQQALAIGMVDEVVAAAQVVQVCDAAMDISGRFCFLNSSVQHAGVLHAHL